MVCMYHRVFEARINEVKFLGPFNDNAPLVRKVYFPREVLPISMVLANLVNFGILPLIFKSPADYDRLEPGDLLEIEDPHGELRRGEITAAELTTSKNSFVETVPRTFETKVRTVARFAASRRSSSMRIVSLRSNWTPPGRTRPLPKRLPHSSRVMLRKSPRMRPQ